MFQNKPSAEDYYFEGGLVKKLESIEEGDFNFNKPAYIPGKTDIGTKLTGLKKSMTKSLKDKIENEKVRLAID